MTLPGPAANVVAWCSTGLPGVIPNLLTDPPTAITDVFFWTPQVVGGTGFIVSSLLLMIECQRRWWLPSLRSLGWHIGVWNLIGAVGFTLCGALGYASSTSSKVSNGSVRGRMVLRGRTGELPERTRDILGIVGILDREHDPTL